MAAAQQYLTFRCSGHHCAILAALVRGITPVESGSAFLPFQQRAVYLLDAAQRLNLQPRAPRENRHAIIIEFDEELAGILCERVTGALSYSEDAKRNGFLLGHGRRRQLLEPASLATTQEIQQARAAHLAQLY